jgi:hypothetical protein
MMRDRKWSLLREDFNAVPVPESHMSTPVVVEARPLASA